MDGAAETPVVSLQHSPQVSGDGFAWSAVDSGALFAGNTKHDEFNKVVGWFSRPYQARFVRIYPEQWVGPRPALRAGVMVCRRCIEVNPADAMRRASSVQNGDVSGTGHNRGRLDSLGGWVSDTQRLGEWYEMDMGQVERVDGIVTQGVHGAYPAVVRYEVAISNDGHAWEYVDNGADFPGSYGYSANDARAASYFSVPVRARYVRVYPQSWSWRLAMRVGLLTCRDCTPAPPGDPEYTRVIDAAAGLLTVPVVKAGEVPEYVWLPEGDGGQATFQLVASSDTVLCPHLQLSHPLDGPVSRHGHSPPTTVDPPLKITGADPGQDPTPKGGGAP